MTSVLQSHTKSKLKSILVCKDCGAEWRYEGLTVHTKCPHCLRKIDARDRKGEKKSKISDSCSFKEWKRNPENRKQSSKDQHERLRRRAFFKISGSPIPTCVRCGCDDVRILEINHKTACSFGPERKRHHSGHGFCRAIVNGSEATDGLEILCRPCNAIHYLEHKLGEKIPMEVVWKDTKRQEAPAC